MKATPTQKILIQEVENQTHYWTNSNDLDSPTHYSNIETEILKLEFDASLSRDECKKFEEILSDLLDFIKSKK